eukprot:TRINITY_DN48914_c0_g1_i1.p1 TRINITY_DN48914_c0_g1~~TRINITY_DN48914_c0_g1_i1.p1  ORF type:complete len:176 (-),score=28.74 TRINITY_DN48914_c0_g1_i1:48-575(-)
MVRDDAVQASFQRSPLAPLLQKQPQGPADTLSRRVSQPAPNPSNFLQRKAASFYRSPVPTSGRSSDVQDSPLRANELSDGQAPESRRSLRSEQALTELYYGELAQSKFRSNGLSEGQVDWLNRLRQRLAVAKLRCEELGAHTPVSYTHLRAHETPEHLVCRLLLEKKKTQNIEHR